jgi:hypothetical protein
MSHDGAKGGEERRKQKGERTDVKKVKSLNRSRKRKKESREIRRPKSEGRKKAEIRNLKAEERGSSVERRARGAHFDTAAMVTEREQIGPLSPALSPPAATARQRGESEGEREMAAVPRCARAGSSLTMPPPLWNRWRYYENTV